MLKIIFVILITVHGLIHLMGFSQAFGLAKIDQLKLEISKLLGMIWLLVFIVLVSSALLLIMNKEYWWVYSFIGVLFSQVLIIIYWQDAKFGTIANVIICIVVILAFSRWNFLKKIDGNVKSIFQTVRLEERKIITSQMLINLPFPVRKWLDNSGIIGKEYIHRVSLKQIGWMKTDPGQKNWKKTSAEQYFNIDEPSFLWHVTMELVPFIEAQGVDSFIEGKGRMQIKLLSIIPIVNSSGKKIDEATLQRYLAEIVWFPSAALSPYIHWEALDSNSAKATMTYKGTKGSVSFYFNKNGEISRLFAYRYKNNTKESKRKGWSIVIKEMKELNGIKIPSKSEVTWQLSEGDFTWYKVAIQNIKYNL